MALKSIIAHLRATLESEKEHKKRFRYLLEEPSVERMRADLETGDREAWILETLETEDTLD